jgi:hypothetical protein
LRRYAQDTAVPIARSRGQIDELLRDWGVNGIQWSDDYQQDRVTLRFIWEHGGLRYMARFEVKLPGREELAADAVDGRSGRLSENKLRALLADRGRSEHRLLLLWLKAALNAVDAGIVSAEALFLPFLEGADGRTFAEAAAPHLPDLLRGSAERLLPEAKKGDKR